MSENPFFELVGAHSYSSEDQKSRVEAEFESFALKHGKKYVHQKEFSQKQAVFGQNFRWVLTHAAHAVRITMFITICWVVTK